MLFEKLRLWRDDQPRSGPENMAVDEWLMKSVGDTAVLRLYSWAGDWVSLGCFQSLAEARKIFGDEPEYVRRWTGGGIVDHRNDLTYTLVIPRGHVLAGKRGNESYCAIHREIARCLGEGGIACDLTPKDSANESAACFEKPVAWDLLGDDGQKLAGAGQRRSRWGVLHQGSVMAGAGALDQLASFLSGCCEEFVPKERESWEELVPKFASVDWLKRVS
ncbi:hypothetical protein N9Y81_03365 [Akkermansiaceae bacterium]|jgi:lipoate-protein ligase A|nr:hypothetical protein [Akkermansiaceae bacterium]